MRSYRSVRAFLVIRMLLGEWIVTALQVPLEIFGHIINKIHDDSAALYQCGLVCRDWPPFVRQNIFMPRSSSASAKRLADHGGRPVNRRLR
jgi:hypothetical protein